MNSPWAHVKTHLLSFVPCRNGMLLHRCTMYPPNVKLTMAVVKLLPQLEILGVVGDGYICTTSLLNPALPFRAQPSFKSFKQVFRLQVN